MPVPHAGSATRHLQDCAGTYLSLGFALLLGLLCAPFTLTALSGASRAALLGYADAVWSAAAAGELSLWMALRQALQVRVLQWCTLYLGSLFAVCTPLVYLCMAGMGFSLGLCSCILFQGLPVAAAVALLAGMLPGLLTVLPALLYTGCTGLYLARDAVLAARKPGGKRSGWLRRRMAGHARALLPGLGVLLLGAAIEGAFCPLLLHWMCGLVR